MKVEGNNLNSNYSVAPAKQQTDALKWGFLVAIIMSTGGFIGLCLSTYLSGNVIPYFDLTVGSMFGGTALIFFFAVVMDISGEGRILPFKISSSRTITSPLPPEEEKISLA